MDLTNHELELMHDMISETADKARHYKDAEMGWDSDDIDAFYALSEKVLNEAKQRGFWWAR